MRRSYEVLFRPALLFLLVSVVFGCNSGDDGGWPTYRHDGRRSGISSGSTALRLTLNWRFKPPHAPKPAWYRPSEEMPRMHEDGVHHVAASGGMVWFGSSVDNKLYALDIHSGELIWSYFARGPIRFAPTYHDHKIYFGSDDGHVYCLEGRTGRLIWKYRAGPSDRKLLGNERMISLWPVRTGVLVEDGTVYFGAGVFPYDGLYLCALDAETGEVVWKNDTADDLVYELKNGGISFHGYLVASKTILYVPTGRSMPAAFSRKTGGFLFYAPPNGKAGGTWGLVSEDSLIAGTDRAGVPVKIAYDEKGERKGDVFASFNGLDMFIAEEISCILTEDGIRAIDRIKYPSIKDKLEKIREERLKQGGNFYKYSNVIFSFVTENAGPFYHGSVDRKGSELNREFDELTRKIVALDKEEEDLKSSACRWIYSGKGLRTLIMSGDRVFAGGDGVVVALNAETGKENWTEEIDGTVLGLAVSKSRLLVSTDDGSIFCFGGKPVSRAAEIVPGKDDSFYLKNELSACYRNAAAHILAETGCSGGYCLVVDCGTGRLVYEIAKQSGLYVIGIDRDPGRIRTARKHLDDAGLYGSRAIVENWDISSLPDYFANLVVSDGLMMSGGMTASPEEIIRVLKPCGGCVCLGRHSDAVDGAFKESLSGFFGSRAGLKTGFSTKNGFWLKAVRGGLAGAAGWTGQYGNPGNTGCSDDVLVKAPFVTLWYGRPGPEGMVERHAKAASPVAMDGRMFIQGENVIMAYDSYNGTPLWKKEIPGAFRIRSDVDGGNLALSRKGLFVAVYDRCLQLDPGSGRTLRTFKVPEAPDGKPRRWGHLSCEGGTLFGSASRPFEHDYNHIWKKLVNEDGSWKDGKEVDPDYAAALAFYKAKCPLFEKTALPDFQRGSIKWGFMSVFPIWGPERMRPQAGPDGKLMASDCLFAYDIDTNMDTLRLKWAHRGRMIAHTSISIGDGHVFFTDVSVNKSERERALQEKRESVEKGVRVDYVDDKHAVLAKDADVRMVLCLDASTGEVLWRKPVDLSGCGGNFVASAYKNGVLLFFGSFSLHDKYRFSLSELKWHRITALSAEQGDVIWSHPLDYMTRPVIIDDEIIIEPRACDLHTGKIKMRTHPVTGKRVPWEFYRPGHGCGTVSASSSCLFYRSMVSAFCDLSNDRGINYYGGIRPGCWINMIPAGGVLLYPEASSGCTCSYPIKSTVVLKHEKSTTIEDWSVFIGPGPITPVKHLAINLGAPGDAIDDAGALWFGYPRQKIKRGLKFSINEKILEGMGFFSRDGRFSENRNSQRHRLFTSGCIGLTQCRIKLLEGQDAGNPARYTVRLGFSAGGADVVFDVKMQDVTVLEESLPAGKTVTRECKGILVKDVLEIDFVPETGDPSLKNAPIINFIEIIREDS